MAASPAMAGTAGASCTAQSVGFPGTDTARFTWSLPLTLRHNATARVQVQPVAGGASPRPWLAEWQARVS